MTKFEKLIPCSAHFVAFALALLLLSLVTIARGQFHHADSTQFLWAGANQYRLWFEPARIDTELSAMVNAKLKVLRIFLDTHNHECYEDPPDAYTFENPIGKYDEASLAKVDYLMAECQRRGIKMIIALANSNNPAPYDTAFGTVVDMYRSPDAIAAFENRFKYFLDHHNALLGKPWKKINDVVWAWEIMNEAGAESAFVAQPLSSEEKHNIIRSFLDTLATHLKRIDPDTYVSLGIAGKAKYKYCKTASGDDIQTLGDIKSADIYTLHYYCYDPQRFDDDLRYVRSLGKLFFVEEFGKKSKEADIIEYYCDVTRFCRSRGVPWMFWRMGHRKDNDWSIFDDDPVWKEVVSPEAHKIACLATNDKWSVNFDSCRTGSDSCRTNVVEDNKIDSPHGFQLYPSFPNPVRLSASGKGATTISFHLPRAAAVDLRLYDLSGREIAVLLNGPRASGAHHITWPIENLPAGLYFCRLRSKQFVQTQKFLVMR